MRPDSKPIPARLSHAEMAQAIRFLQCQPYNPAVLRRVIRDKLALKPDIPARAVRMRCATPFIRALITLERTLELEIAKAQIEHLLHPRTGVEHRRQQRVVAPSIGRATMARKRKKE